MKTTRGEGDLMGLLTETEQRTIEQFNDTKRTVAVGHLAELATILATAEAALDKLRETDPRLASKIGKKASQVTRLLQGIGVGDDDAVAAPADAVVTEPILHAVEADKVALEGAVVITESEPVAAIELAPVATLSPFAESWLMNKLGENWREDISANETDDEAAIASKIIAANPPRSAKNTDRFIEQITLRLQGVATKEIAAHFGVTGGAISMFESNLKKRVNGSDAAPTEESHAVAVHTEAPVAAPTPIERARPVAPKPTPTPSRSKEVVSDLPPHTHLAQLLQDRIGLDGTARVGLASFLDPKSTGDMTAAKQAAVEATANYLRPYLDDPTYKLDPEELRWVRHSFGVFIENGTPKNREPIPLKDLRKSVRTPEQALRVDAAVFSGLSKLLTKGPNAELVRLRRSDAVSAALEPQAYDDESFEAIRTEVQGLLAERFDEATAAVIIESVISGKTPGQGMDVPKESRAAFSKVRQMVMERGKPTGWVEIDKSMQRFLATGHAGVARVTAALTAEEMALHERRVVAGLYVHLEREDKERVA